MHEWLEHARDRIAAAGGDPPDGYSLSDEDVDTLLGLARVAAHESGERVNAPLLTYLVGVARGRHPDKDLREFADDVIDKGT